MQKETMEALEAQIMDSMENIQIHELGTSERNKAVAETCELLDRFNVAEQAQMEYWDKEDRRRIEEKRNEMTAELDREKNSLTNVKLALEIAKIVIPVIVPMIGYGIFQKRMLKFEETGRVNSTAGRELHLPKFYK